MPAAPDPSRLEALEQAVADLRRDVQELRAALAEAGHAARAPSDAARPPAPAATRPAAPPVAFTGGDALDRRLGAPGVAPPAGLAVARTLRERAAALAGAAAPGTGPGAEGADLEAVVGRYGTVAVAALLIVMAAGAFLTWAVANFDLTPTARLGLGALAAAALAGVGIWLRRRAAAPTSAGEDPAARDGSRRFGDVLLALALAVTHVEAWAAGPYLRLVPPAVALAAAAAASVALAALAWRGRQQSLFLVGVGGALVAPFVTGSAAEHPSALRLYGWVVLASALLAIPADERRRWQGALRLLALGGTAYTAAYLDRPLAMAAVGNPAGLVLPGWMLERHAPVLFALASAVVPLALTYRRGAAAPDVPAPGAPTADASVPEAPYARLTLVYLLAGTLALIALAFEGAGAGWWTGTLAAAATLLAYATVPALGTPAPRPASVLGWLPLTRVVTGFTPAAVALTLPLLLLGAALAGLPRVVGVPGAAVAALWAAMAAGAAVAAWRAATAAAPGSARLALPSAHAAAAGLASALVPVFLLSPHDVPRAGALGVHAGLTALLLRRLRHPLALLSPALVGGVAAAWAWILLDQRTPYAYTPFLTAESLAAALVVAAWVTIARLVWQDGRDVFPTGERRFVVGLAVAVALGWGRQELAHAVAPDVATVLVIAYFALAGVGSIAFGRARRAPAARQIGLVLSLYAAVKALLQASQLEAVGLRVLSYLVVGGFLLGIAYWYRAAGARPAGPSDVSATQADPAGPGGTGRAPDGVPDRQPDATPAT